MELFQDPWALLTHCILISWWLISFESFLDYGLEVLLPCWSYWDFLTRSQCSYQPWRFPCLWMYLCLVLLESTENSIMRYYRSSVLIASRPSARFTFWFHAFCFLSVSFCLFWFHTHSSGSSHYSLRPALSVPVVGCVHRHEYCVLISSWNSRLEVRSELSYWNFLTNSFIT